MNRFLLFTIITFFFSLGSTVAQNDLEVVKGRNVRSAAENGALFSLEITNNSASSQEYVITTQQLNTPCDTSRMKNYHATIDLDIQIVNIPTATLLLPARTSKVFQVRVSTQKGTPYNTWSCVEVKATSSSRQQASATLLKVFVPDPSEG